MTRPFSEPIRHAARPAELFATTSAAKRMMPRRGRPKLCGTDPMRMEPSISGMPIATHAGTAAAAGNQCHACTTSGRHKRMSLHRSTAGRTSNRALRGRTVSGYAGGQDGVSVWTALQTPYAALVVGGQFSREQGQLALESAVGEGVGEMQNPHGVLLPLRPRRCCFGAGSPRARSAVFRVLTRPPYVRHSIFAAGPPVEACLPYRSTPRPARPGATTDRMQRPLAAAEDQTRAGARRPGLRAAAFTSESACA